jgi:hypothetical protein
MEYIYILCDVLYNYCSAEEIPRAQYCKMLYVVEEKKIYYNSVVD